MATQEHCTVEHLAAVFAQYQEEIIDEWRREAGELLEDLHLDHATLTDHIPDIVAEIICDLSLRREGAVPVEQIRGSQLRHGLDRVAAGLDVGEVVAEYNLVRTAFYTVADRHGLYLVGEAARIINRRIDGGVRISVMTFAARQAALRRIQEDEHLSFIAHDLRTPLNAVSLLVQELKEDPASIETGNLFTMLGSNLKRIETLIRRVLDSSVRLEELSGSFHPKRRSFELRPVVDRLLGDLRSIYSKEGIEVVNEIPAGLSLFADSALISQVFQNLLGNAFKYAAHGRVVVSARKEAGAVTCVVQDNGAGIPLELLANVFDKLTSDPDKPGTGIGLTIVKQIVEAHGGSVSAESTHGAGATFTFSILTPQES
jgi:signal transduction histidine kinase